MDIFDIAQSKIGESAQKVATRAIEEARRRSHPFLTNEHIFFAFAQVEWTTFSEVMRDFKQNPREILKALEVCLQILPQSAKELAVTPAIKLVFKLAFHRANRAGRQTIESFDLFSAIFEEGKGTSVSIIRRHGIEPDILVSRIITRIRDVELREEESRKRFELPPFLKQYATNLNLLARQNKIHPAYGREKEIQQVLEILCHRERSNSAMIIGEPGVGKTAIVEGLAKRIEFDPESIPIRLRDCQIVNIQMHTMVAGTMLRGMFEDRIQSIVREIKEHPNFILFVDEAHTIIGAGSALGVPSDAADILKSVLARGEVRMIGATTLGEYKEYIQEDEALARRFRNVYIQEPTISETKIILCSLKSRLERSYSVSISDEAIDTALEMSERYQRHLHLPDKVISWLDTASVRAEIDERWKVDSSDVIDVISHATQIPKDMVSRDTSERFNDIEQHLAGRVIGQKKAIQAIANRLILNKGPIKDGFNRPDGVLLFLGPTGVGKTELAKASAEFLFGDEKKMIRIDMSEYQDSGASVDKLIGMPRGIVGSERGGILTNQLKDNPYSVVLLDEIEKASPSVLNLFLAAFDEGWLTDGRGRRVYLSDAIIIMTSNVGSEHFRKLTNPLGFYSGQVPISQIQSEINRELEHRFSPEFRNRIDGMVIFSPLSMLEVEEITSRYLAKLAETMKKMKKNIIYSKSVIKMLAKKGHSLAFGARQLKRVIDDLVKLPISQRWKESDTFQVKSIDSDIIIEPETDSNKDFKVGGLAIKMKDLGDVELV